MEAARLFPAVQTRNDHTGESHISLPPPSPKPQSSSASSHFLLHLTVWVHAVLVLVPNNPGRMFSTSPLESRRNLLIGVPPFSGILQQLLTYHVPPLTKLTSALHPLTGYMVGLPGSSLTSCLNPSLSLLYTSHKGLLATSQT